LGIYDYSIGNRYAERQDAECGKFIGEKPDLPGGNVRAVLKFRSSLWDFADATAEEFARSVS
jgi:hypothetical protein